jgi:hypothetical protein
LEPLLCWCGRPFGRCVEVRRRVCARRAATAPSATTTRPGAEGSMCAVMVLWWGVLAGPAFGAPPPPANVEWPPVEQTGAEAPGPGPSAAERMRAAWEMAGLTLTGLVVVLGLLRRIGHPPARPSSSDPAQSDDVVGRAERIFQELDRGNRG